MLMLSSLFLPSVFDVLNEFCILLLGFNDFFMEISDSRIQNLVLDGHLGNLLIEKSYIGLVLAAHEFLLGFDLMERLMKIVDLIVC
jgi:hypothetical protein